MKSDVPPLLIGTASMDPMTATVVALCVMTAVALLIGLRKDVAAFALVAGTLTIALMA